jgi:predicted transcriptional regulator
MGTNRHKNDNIDGTKSAPNDETGVPPKDREQMVLEFLAEHGFPLPPKAIYRGLRVKRNITFAYRTVQNILARLLEEGEVMRVDKDALDEGEIKPLPDEEAGRRTYYYITEKGLERIGRLGL